MNLVFFFSFSNILFGIKLFFEILTLSVPRKRDYFARAANISIITRHVSTVVVTLFVRSTLFVRVYSDAGLCRILRSSSPGRDRTGGEIADGTERDGDTYELFYNAIVLLHGFPGRCGCGGGVSWARDEFNELLRRAGRKCACHGP